MYVSVIFRQGTALRPASCALQTISVGIIGTKIKGPFLPTAIAAAPLIKMALILSAAAAAARGGIPLSLFLPLPRRPIARFNPNE